MRGYSWRKCGDYDEKTQEYLCSYCNKTVAGKKHHIVKFDNLRIETDEFYILECPSCNKPTIYNVFDKTTYPFTKVLLPVQYLSKNIDTIYNEIRSAISAGCYTSAVILARTAIMHVAVEHEAEENKSFVYYVNYLIDKGYVPPSANVWIDKIRTMANDSVHKLEIWQKKMLNLLVIS